MGRRSDGIFQTLRDEVALSSRPAAGNGFSFSRLRPKGDSVASSVGVATGRSASCKYTISRSARWLKVDV